MLKYSVELLVPFPSQYCCSHKTVLTLINSDDVWDVCRMWMFYHFITICHCRTTSTLRRLRQLPSLWPLPALTWQLFWRDWRWWEASGQLPWPAVYWSVYATLSIWLTQIGRPVQRRPVQRRNVYGQNILSEWLGSVGQLLLPDRLRELSIILPRLLFICYLYKMCTKLQKTWPQDGTFILCFINCTFVLN